MEKHFSKPVVNLINILRTNFSYEHHFGSFFYVLVTREKLPKQRSYKKCAHKILMKLTPILPVRYNEESLCVNYRIINA